MQKPQPYCGNCKNSQFERIEGVYAITKVEKSEKGIIFLPSSGIPVIAYVCVKCGEIKLYPAKAFGEI